jgi:hypothetical protein
MLSFRAVGDKAILQDIQEAWDERRNSAKSAREEQRAKSRDG